ncbi:3-oxoacyl-[acyl-carrier-protein] synthase 3 B, chloroplastic [Auxenochlorella protothecoides]|uniref:beta-ketoacyl-[acyl-carrier-protein] synthase III n=2 Tax=Auxenochlorella protothecoides TaxID=3075 RepID=A0A087SMM2_AUXPR|nr:3-oxoacyl-[acyl-carrier-protein] synthase 3 B, chloroplastic [Auxenochlorella protothecoides]KFM26976.1 3-oxoacyl-[acyl-carrier-protein] synthase 3 B, chloroplastic [Auxenochlorella protothecoides]
MVGSSSGYIESLPEAVQRRIEYLGDIDEQRSDLEAEFDAKVKQLEEEYSEKYAPLDKELRDIVNGVTEAPGVVTEEGADNVPKGIPDFWMIALRNEPHLETLSFTLVFKFAENPFFKNETLSKTYFMGDDEDLVIRDIKATPIEWKSASKNVTVKVLKKKMRPGQKGTPPTKQTPTESFFNWFTPPPIPENEEEIEEEELEGLQAAMEDDYEVAEIIREKIIDHPYLWFTGEALQDDESSEEDYDSEDDGATPGGETDDESPSDDEDDSEDDDSEGEGEEETKRSKSTGKTGPKAGAVDSQAQPQECRQHNADLERLVDTNDEWIVSRTGIRRRHILAQGESLADHALLAAQRALAAAGVPAADVDLVLLATSSPDDGFGTACAVQARLGAGNAAAFDLTAACSGFVMGVVTAAQFLRTGAYRNVLVIGADALSRYIDWRDRGTCILFGDGAGAVLLQAGGEGERDNLLGHDLRSDGNGQRHLHSRFLGAGDKALNDDTASSHPAFANIAMNGSEVFKFAVRAVPKTVEAALGVAQLEVKDLDWLVLHQANQRILTAAADRLGVPADRVISNLAEYGNTSAASIPLALDEAVRAGTIKQGDVVAIAGFGAGLSWAAAILRWG